MSLTTFPGGNRLAERKSYTIVEDDASASSADAESDDSASVRNSDNEAEGSDDSDDFNAQKQGCQDSTPLNGTTKRLRSRLVEDDTDDSNVPHVERPLSSPEAMRDHYSIELQGSLVETNLKLRNEVFNLSKDLDAERRDRKLCDELVAETRKQGTADVAQMEEKLKKLEEERARVLSRKNEEHEIKRKAFEAEMKMLHDDFTALAREFECKKKSSRSLAIPARLTTLTTQLSERNSIISSLEDALANFVAEAHELRRERTALEKRIYELETKASELAPPAHRSKSLEQMASDALLDRDAAVSLAQQHETLAHRLEEELQQARAESGGNRTVEVEQLYGQLEMSGEELARAAKARKEIEGRLQISDGKLTAVAAQLAAANTAIQEKETAVKQLQISLESAQERLKSAVAQNGGRDKETQELEASLNDTKATTRKLSQQLAEQDNIITELESGRDVAEARYRGVQQQNVALLAAIASAAAVGGEKETYRNAKEGIAGLATLVDNAEEARKNLQTARAGISRLEDTLEALKAKCETTENDLEDATQRLAMLTGVESKFQTLQSDNNVLLDAIAASVSHRRNAAKYSTVSEAISALEEFADNFGEAESKLADAQEDLARQGVTARMSRDVEARLADELAQARQRLRELESNKETALEIEHATARRLEVAEALAEGLDREKRALEQRLREHEQQRERNMAQLDDRHGEELGKAQRRVEDLQSKSETWLASENETARRLQDALERLEGLESDKSDLDAQICEQRYHEERSVELLESELQKRRQESDALSRRLTAMMSREAENVAALQSAANDSHALRARISTEVDELRASLEAARSDHARLELKYMHMRAKNAAADEEVSRLLDSIAALQRGGDDALEDATRRVLELEGEAALLRASNAEVESEVEALRASKAAIEEAVAALERRVRDDAAQAREGEVRVSALRAQLTERHAAIAEAHDVRREADELRRNAAAERDALRSALDWLRGRLQRVDGGGGVGGKWGEDGAAVAEETGLRTVEASCCSEEGGDALAATLRKVDDLVVEEARLRSQEATRDAEVARLREEKDEMVSAATKARIAAEEQFHKAADERDSLRRSLDRVRERLLRASGGGDSGSGAGDGAAAAARVFHSEEVDDGGRDDELGTLLQAADGMAAEDARLRAEAATRDAEVVRLRGERDAIASAATKERLVAEETSQKTADERDSLRRALDRVRSRLRRASGGGSGEGAGESREARSVEDDAGGSDDELTMMLQAADGRAQEEARLREANTALGEEVEVLQEARCRVGELLASLLSEDGLEDAPPRDKDDLKGAVAALGARLRKVRDEAVKAAAEAEKMMCEKTAQIAALNDDLRDVTATAVEQDAARVAAEAARKADEAVSAAERAALEEALEEANSQLECVLVSAETLAARIARAQADTARMNDAEAAAADAARRLRAEVAARKAAEERLGEAEGEAAMAMAGELERAREEVDEAGDVIVEMSRKLDQLKEVHERRREAEGRRAADEAARLGREAEEARKGLAEALREKDALVGQVAELVAVKETLQEEKEDAEERLVLSNKGVGAKVDALTAANETLEEELSEAHARRVAACRGKEDLEPKVMALVAKEAGLRQECTILDAEKRGLEEEVTALREEVADCRLQVLSAVGRAEELGRQVVEHRSRAADSTREVSQVSSQIAELQGQVATLSAAVEESQERLSEAVKEKTELEAKVVELAAELTESENQQARLENQTQALNKQVVELTAATSVLHADVADTHKKLEHGEGLASNCDMETKRLAEEVPAGRSDGESLRSAEEGDKSARQLAPSFAITVEEKASAYQALLKECRTLESKYSLWDRQRKEEDTSKAAAAVQIAILADEKARLEHELAEVRGCLEELEHQKCLSEEKLKAAEHTIAKQNAAASDMARSFRELEDSVTTNDGELANSLDLIDQELLHIGMPPEVEAMTPVSVRSREMNPFAADAGVQKVRPGKIQNETNLARVARLRQRCIETERSRQAQLLQLRALQQASAGTDTLRATRAQGIQQQRRTIKACEDDLAALKLEIRQLQAVDMCLESAVSAPTDPQMQERERKRRQEVALNEILTQLESEVDNAREQFTAMAREAALSPPSPPLPSPQRQMPGKSASSKVLRLAVAEPPPSATNDGLECDSRGSVILPDTSWIVRRGE